MYFITDISKTNITKKFILSLYFLLGLIEEI